MKPKEYFQGVWGQNLDSGFQKQSYHYQVKFEKKKKKKAHAKSKKSWQCRYENWSSKDLFVLWKAKK